MENILEFFIVKGVGTSSSECADTYRGRSAFSEIEVRNVANYLSRNKNNLAGYMDIHAYSQLWMTPWGYTRRYPRDYSEMVCFCSCLFHRQQYSVSKKLCLQNQKMFFLGGGVVM